MFHFPKNPFCDTCNRAKLLASRVRRKPRPDHEPDDHAAKCFGEVIAADHIHVYRSPDSSSTPSREYVVLCIRDKSSLVCLRLIPALSAPQNLLWLHCASLLVRRLLRRQCLFCLMLQRPLKPQRKSWVGFIALRCPIGLLTTLTWSVRFVRLRDFAVAHLGYDDIPPIKCVLGQLVFCRSRIGDKFAPNAAPGLFAGWRLEPGCAYKGVGLVLDLAKLKNRSGAWTDPLPGSRARDLCQR